MVFLNTYLGHRVSQSVLVLFPVLAKVGAALDVKVSVVLEDASLLDVLFISIRLLLGFRVTEFVVLGGSQSVGNVRLTILNLSNLELQDRYATMAGSECWLEKRSRRQIVVVVIITYVLLGTGTIVVLVLDRSEKVHAEDLVKEGFTELRSSASLGDRGEPLHGCNDGKYDES